LRLRYAPVAYLASAVHPRLEDITGGVGSGPGPQNVSNSGKAKIGITK